MIHRPASSQLCPPRRGIPRTSRMLAALGGLAVFLAAAIGLAPAALATPPPEPSVATPPLAPSAAVPAHFSPWAIAAILAATSVLSAATLITLALEHTRRARRQATAIAEPPASLRTPITASACYDGPAEILDSHPARGRSHWPATIHVLSTRTRRWMIGAAIVTALILIGVLNNIQPGMPPDSGLVGCTAVSGTRQVAAANYPRIRAEFAGSRWPDLRAAGASYVDLVIKLRRPQYTDGYETVPYYQQLSAACAKHGRMLNAGI